MSCCSPDADAFSRSEAGHDALEDMHLPEPAPAEHVASGSPLVEARGAPASTARAAGLPPIEGNPNLSDQLVTALTRAIICGHFKPGDHIKEKDIAEYYAVSRVPVREALRSLEADGWIVIRPRRGAFVQEHTTVELIGLHEMRAIVEPRIAGLAAQRRSALQLERLRKIIMHGCSIAKSGSLADAAVNNREFHVACAACSGNDHAVRVIANLEQRLQCYLSLSPDLRAATTVVDHETIFRAIEVRDEAAASAAMTEHLRAAGSFAMQRLRTLPAADGDGAERSGVTPMAAARVAKAAEPAGKLLERFFAPRARSRK
ncbi:MAG TPA: GntR family transcriptional regulator, partial [Hyphomicrobiaceae bacterium]|nr:GntR family transcriptional regulator [Hyphomicrobiaceae bacterium]